MDARFINAFIGATLNVLTTMCQVKPEAGKPELKKDNKTWGVVTGLIGISGTQLAGNLIISFDQGSVLQIVSNMLMEQFKEVNDQVVDAVGEITNMISGGAKGEISKDGFQFSMATPAMIVGKDMTISQLGRAPIVSVPFTVSNGKFVVEAALAPVPGAAAPRSTK